jgi:hypothetical protein
VVRIGFIGFIWFIGSIGCIRGLEWRTVIKVPLSCSRCIYTQIPLSGNWICHLWDQVGSTLFCFRIIRLTSKSKLLKIYNAFRVYLVSLAISIQSAFSRTILFSGKGDLCRKGYATCTGTSWVASKSGRYIKFFITQSAFSCTIPFFR